MILIAVIAVLLAILFLLSNLMARHADEIKKKKNKQNQFDCNQKYWLVIGYLASGASRTFSGSSREPMYRTLCI